MSLEPSRFPLRKRRTRPEQQCESSLDREDNQINSGKSQDFEPWIVNLLLEYKESETKTDGHFGIILKVLNDTSALKYGEQCPAAILTVADKYRYIQTIITAQAAQMLKCAMPQSGFSGFVGQLILLTNYKVCFKESSEMEKCEFYLIANCFHVLRMKRFAMNPQDCNREPSILQKIKDLWLKRRALQPPQSSEPLVVGKEDRLNTLKENVQDCLGVFSPNTELDSEQLAAYPDTTLHAKPKQDTEKPYLLDAQVTLVFVPRRNKAIGKVCPPEESKTVPHDGDRTEEEEEEDSSTMSFFSAVSNNSDGTLENPWDVFPGTALTTSSGK